MPKCSINDLSQEDLNTLTNNITKKFNNSNLQTAKVNNLIDQATDAVLCNPQCQFEREAAALEQLYLTAETNIETAPMQLFESRKNYMVFTEGQSEYNQYMTNLLTAKAEKTTTEFTKRFDSETKELESFNYTYNALVINFKNVVDLYIKYKKENIELKKQLKEDVADIFTNDRKSFYEDQQLDTLKNYYFYLLLLMYFVCVLFFIILFLTYPSNYNWKITVGVLICLIILPFISYWILAFLVFVAYKIYGLLPKNVYTEQVDLNKNNFDTQFYQNKNTTNNN
jgi:hypothetical protein